MSRLPVLVALCVLLSGCALAPGGSKRTPTVTPAPVPDDPDDRRVAGPTATPTIGCVAPPVASDAPAPPPTPATAAPLPTANGTVDGRALVETHVAALATVSYHLATDRYEVWVAPNRSAFVYAARLPPITHRWYAVAGTLYVHIELESGTAFVRQRPYDPSMLADDSLATLIGAEATLLTPPNAAYTEPEGSHGTLSGREWLTTRIGDVDFAVTGTTTWRGTPVRVLRPTTGTATATDAPASPTVYVDRRGVVRYVERASGDGTAARATETLRVTDVGVARIQRPPAFCGPDIEGVAPLETAEPAPNGTATP